MKTRKVNPMRLPLSCPLEMSAGMVRRLMRVHGWTIKSIAQRMGITMKRVREVRARGCENQAVVADWLEAILGRAAYLEAYPEGWEHCQQK